MYRINFFNNTLKKRNKILKKFYDYVFQVLKGHDEYTGDLSAKVFDALYVSEEVISQLKLSFELSLDQSNISRRYSKIGLFMEYVLLSRKEFEKLIPFHEFKYVNVK